MTLNVTQLIFSYTYVRVFLRKKNFSGKMRVLGFLVKFLECFLIRMRILSFLTDCGLRHADPLTGDQQMLIFASAHFFLSFFLKHFFQILIA